MAKRYNRRPEPKTESYGTSPLPVERPAAIYYRQSTDAQIGNINTTLQTVDMFEHLVRQGWSPDTILMIDMDAGVSGSKKISERPGFGVLVQRKLLEDEGVVFDERDRVDMKRYAWQPAAEWLRANGLAAPADEPPAAGDQPRLF